MSEKIIALLHGPDKAGLVAKVSGWIYERGGNIEHADQHIDRTNKIFFQRLQWIPANCPEKEIVEFKEFATKILEMKCDISRQSVKKKIVLMTSQHLHCFCDIVTRQRLGELNCDIACAVSNHETSKDFSEKFNIKFHYTPITKDTKEDVEKKHLEIIKDSSADLIVMARYMQILSADFLKKCKVPIINIHHSFLPAFAGAKPYHQAYERGVKIIGATAHYATADLDEGPIIAQNVTTISHRNSIEDLMRKGKDLEKTVLALAVRLHLEKRILSYKNRTVIFD